MATWCGIDPQAESLLSLSDAARLLPKRRGGKKPHVSCLYRWSVSGCRGVILETIQVGGTRCTSHEALARFFERLSSQSLCSPGVPRGRSARQRERATEQAERELKEEGIDFT
jgi:hypothetical protein